MAGEIEAYIRSRAAALGIDPDVAVRVARSEGGLRDPIRQSDVRKGDIREPSYGPFQLLIGGKGTGFGEGLGNAALRQGIDPRDPNQWKQAVDFALGQANQGGWSPWYGAKNSGISQWQGIGGNRGTNLNSIPAPGDLAPVIVGGRDIADRPIAEVAGSAPATSGDFTKTPDAERTVAQAFSEGGFADALKEAGSNKKFGTGFDAFMSAMGGGASRNAQAEAHSTPMNSILPAMEAADAGRVANAQMLMQNLMKAKKVRGLSLMG